MTASAVLRDRDAPTQLHSIFKWKRKKKSGGLNTTYGTEIV